MTAEAAARGRDGTPGWAYDEDGYCVSCGNGRWKFHAPECKLRDALDLLPPGGKPVTFAIDWMGRPHTSNKERQLNHFALSRIHEGWKAAGTQAARITKLRNLPPCIVSFQGRYPGGTLPDTGAIAPTGKCIIDGLVAAGVWPDDTAEWVTEERYLPPIKAPGQPAIIVTLTPVVRS